MAAGFEAGHVAAVRDLSAEIRNITIRAESLAGVAFEPGADVVIRLPPGDGGGGERRYSVWKSNPAAGTLDVCIVQHRLGPGSRWAARCAAGDPVEIARSHTLPIALDHAAAAHIFLGDESSIAATEALIGALPAYAGVSAWFEVASPARRWPAADLLRPNAISWIDCEGRPGAALLVRLAREPLEPAEHTTVYVTGEAWLCAMVHGHLVRERGFRRAAVRAMPYWKARPPSSGP